MYSIHHDQHCTLRLRDIQVDVTKVALPLQVHLFALFLVVCTLHDHGVPQSVLHPNCIKTVTCV